MGTKQAVLPLEEMQNQSKFLQKIKDWSDEEYKRTGKRKMALVRTYGCQQNENDSERICGILQQAGFGFCESVSDADLIIYNTCAVRKNAEQRVFGNLGALKHEKQRRPELVIGVCGCMMQQEHIVEEISQKYRHIDLIFGTHTLYKLPQLLWEALSSRKIVVGVEQIDGIIAEGLPIKREGSVKAYVSIMHGCNNFCSYCIVPYVRGREVSRRPSDILKEVRQIAKEGYKEVTLLGQNVNSYGKNLDKKIDFSDLIWLISEVDGIERIRFTTSHPKDFGEKLIKTMAECDKVCHHLHLPVQAGSNKVLSDMNRGYTREEYLEKIKRLRSAIPDIAITSDIIVGFPTETQDDFLQTLSLIEEVRFDSVYSFIYSKRTGTSAAKLQPILCDEQIHKNFDRLLGVQNRISKEINDSYVGGVYKVLVEGESKTDPTKLTGRTSSAKIVNFEASKDCVGKIIDVKITSSQTWSLTGEVESI